MKLRKIICLLLLCAVCLSLFACSDDDERKTDQNVTEQESADALRPEFRYHGFVYRESPFLTLIQSENDILISCWEYTNYYANTTDYAPPYIYYQSPYGRPTAPYRLCLSTNYNEEEMVFVFEESGDEISYADIFADAPTDNERAYAYGLPFTYVALKYKEDSNILLVIGVHWAGDTLIAESFHFDCVYAPLSEEFVALLRSNRYIAPAAEEAETSAEA